MKPVQAKVATVPTFAASEETAMTSRPYTVTRAAEARRRRQLAAAAVVDLETQLARARDLHLDATRMLALGIDPRF
jgi:hypothetical protein